MTFTDAARELLQRLEGFRSTAYRDRAGVWTIGFGHTGDVHPGQALTQHQAEVVFDLDVQRFCVGVEHLVRRAMPLSDEEFSALVLFAFNVGLTAFAGSTALRDLLSGHFDLVPAELKRWVYVHDVSGVPLLAPELVARRNAEIALWKSGASAAVA